MKRVTVCGLITALSGLIADVSPASIPTIAPIPCPIGNTDVSDVSFGGIDYVLRSSTTNQNWYFAAKDCECLVKDGSENWLIAAVDTVQLAGELAQTLSDNSVAWIGVKQIEYPSNLNYYFIRGLELINFGLWDQTSINNNNQNNDPPYCAVLNEADSRWSAVQCSNSISVNRWICQRVDQRKHFEIGDGNAVRDSDETLDWNQVLIDDSPVFLASDDLVIDDTNIFTSVFNTALNCARSLAEPLLNWCWELGLTVVQSGNLRNQIFHPFLFTSWINPSQEHSLYYFAIDHFDGLDFPDSSNQRRRLLDNEEVAYVPSAKQRKLIWLFRKPVTLNEHNYGFDGEHMNGDLGLLIHTDQTDTNTIRQAVLFGWFNGQIYFLSALNDGNVLCPSIYDISHLQNTPNMFCIAPQKIGQPVSASWIDPYYYYHYKNDPYFMEGVIDISKALSQLYSINGQDNSPDYFQFSNIPCYSTMLSASILGSDDLLSSVTNQTNNAVLWDINSGTPRDFIVSPGGFCATSIGIDCRLYDQTVLFSLRNHGLRGLEYIVSATITRQDDSSISYSIGPLNGHVGANSRLPTSLGTLATSIQGPITVDLSVDWYLKGQSLSDHSIPLRTQHYSGYCEAATYPPSPSPIDAGQCADTKRFFQRLHRDSHCVVVDGQRVCHRIEDY